MRIDLNRRAYRFLWVFLLFVLSFSSIDTQAQLDVSINTLIGDGRFCTGSPEELWLFANVTGGEKPYTYKWTFTGDTEFVVSTDYLRFTPDTSGRITLQVTDSSPTLITKSANFDIEEIFVNASIDFSPDGDCSETPISFNAIVSGGTGSYSYKWDFGDSNTSSQKNPVHAYVASGCNEDSAIYNVHLDVFDADKCPASADTTVYVLRKPHLRFKDMANLESPFKHCHNSTDDISFTVTLANHTTDDECIDSYNVIWGDESVDIDVTFPVSHEYTTRGAFELRVEAISSDVSCDLKWETIVYNQNFPEGTFLNYDKHHGCMSEEYGFIITGHENNATGTSYNWDFGDGSDTILYHGSFSNDTIWHSFIRSNCELGGIFEIKLDIINGCEVERARGESARIGSPPEAIIGITSTNIDSICTNQLVEFYNNSNPGYNDNCSQTPTYQWDFGDGSTYNSSGDPSNTWVVPGNYTISLEATNDCGSSVDSIQIVVMESPNADFVFSETAGCSPLSPKITNSSTGDGLLYQWRISSPNDPSDYNFISGSTTGEPVIEFLEPGSYEVIGLVYNTCFRDSMIFNLEVYDVPEGNISSLNNVCITDPTITPIVVSNSNYSAITSFMWTFTGGDPSGFSGKNPGTIRYTTPGSYTAEVSMTNSCGTTNVSSNFQVYDTPEISMNASAIICETGFLDITGTTISKEASILWESDGDGYFNDPARENPIYYPGQNDIIKEGTILHLTAFGFTPCADLTEELELTIRRTPVINQIDADITICEGFPYQILNAEPEFQESLLWTSSGDGEFSDLTSRLPEYTPGEDDLAAGSVVLTLTAYASSPCSMSASESFEITYADEPEINAGIDKDICQDGRTQLVATGSNNISVSWKVETGTGNFDTPDRDNTGFFLDPLNTADPVVLVVAGPGGYGCPTAYDTIVLDVIPYPVVEAGDNVTVCISKSIGITGASVDEDNGFTWAVPGEGSLDNLANISPVYTPGINNPSEKVRLTLTAFGNSVCGDKSDDVYVNIQRLPIAKAGADQEICKGSNFSMEGDTIYGSSVEWITHGNGNFIPDEFTLKATYIPSQDDLDNDSVELVLKLTGSLPCLEEDRDTVWLKFIDPPEVFAGNDTLICSSTFVVPDGSAYSKYPKDYKWRFIGNGNITGEKTLTPTYEIDQSDVSVGSVILILESENLTCPIERDSVTVSITPFPVSFAGVDDSICEDKTKALLDSDPAFYDSLVWSTSGDGSFTDSVIEHPVYIPGSKDIEAGTVTLYLTANGLKPCTTPAVDSLELRIQKNPNVFAGRDTLIGEDATLTTIYAYDNYVDHINWSRVGGGGNFTNQNNAVCSYTPNAEDIANEGVHLVITGTSLNPCSTVVMDTIFVQVRPMPKVDAGDDERICEGASVTIQSSSEDQTSRLLWTSSGNGTFDDSTSLFPTYTPDQTDIANREVTLTIKGWGKEPITDYYDISTMKLTIIHNSQVDLIAQDTSCENRDYFIQSEDIIYQDPGEIIWRTSGQGSFLDSTVQNPQYVLDVNDKKLDSIYFYVELQSILPCTKSAYDTMLIRLFHEPEPGFYPDQDTGCAPLVVNLTNTSVGEEITYSWDLGNGESSFDKHPSNVIYQQGILADTSYTITLEVLNRCSAVSTSQEITVKPIPIAGFGQEYKWECSPKDVEFINTTTGLADSYTWNWGDGTEPSLEEEPGSHVFTTGSSIATYTINLIAENECGVDSIQKEMIVYPNTIKAFFAVDTSFGCAPFDVMFTNYTEGGTDTLSVVYDFGDGPTYSDSSRYVHHVFEEPGDYMVAMSVQDKCSRAWDTLEIRVLDVPPIEFFTDRTAYCEYDTVFMQPVNYLPEDVEFFNWDFGDSTGGSYSFEEHVYDSAGAYRITLEAKEKYNMCSAFTYRDVIIHAAPIAKFSIPDNDLCQPLEITFRNETLGADYYAWNFGNGNSSVDRDGYQIFRDDGQFTITLRAEDKEGCIDTVQHRIRVNPKPISAFEASSLQTCFPPSDVQFTNLSEAADDFRWDFGNGLYSDDTNESTTFSDYGDYQITLIATNIFHCSDTSELIYHVYHNPIADFSVDTTIGCDPFTAGFRNNSEYDSEYYWTFDDQGTAEQENPEFTFNGEGVYTVKLKVIGDGGCTDSITKEDFITTNPSPVADFNYTIVNDVDTVQFYNYSSGALSYLWDFGDGNSSEEEGPLHRYSVDTTHYITLLATNEYDCSNLKRDSVVIEFPSKLFFPNALSPGNMSEGVRIFKPAGVGLLKYHFVIYDTWGNLIWETTKLKRGQPAEGWDGTLNGELLDPDVYVWHLKEAVFIGGASYDGERYGTITLIR